MSIIKKIYVYCYVFSCMYFIDSKLDKIAMAFHLSIILYMYIKTNQLDIFKVPFMPFIVLIPYTLILHITFSTYDFMIDNRLIRLIIFSYGIYMFTKFMKKDIIYMLNALINILYISTIISYVQYFNIFGLRYVTLAFTSSIKEYWYVGYRAMGLFDGYDLNGIMLASSVSLISMYLIINKSISKWEKNKKFFMCLTSLIAMLFASRTGIIFLVLILMIVAMLSGSYIKKYSIKIIKIVMVSIFAIGVLIKSLPNSTYSKLEESFEFIFEAIVSYTQGSGFTTDSSTDLFANHYFLPKKTINVIFGNGMGINSDSAYIQTIFKFGIIGLIFYLVIFLCLVNKNFKILGTNSISNKFKWIAKFNVAFILGLLVICIKGPYFYSEKFILILMYTLSIVFIAEREMCNE